MFGSAQNGQREVKCTPCSTSIPKASTEPGAEQHVLGLEGWQAAFHRKDGVEFDVSLASQP